MNQINVLFIGPPASGKTTLAKIFRDRLDALGYKANVVFEAGQDDSDRDEHWDHRKVRAVMDKGLQVVIKEKHVHRVSDEAPVHEAGISAAAEQQASSNSEPNLTLYERQVLARVVQNYKDTLGDERPEFGLTLRQLDVLRKLAGDAKPLDEPPVHNIRRPAARRSPYDPSLPPIPCNEIALTDPQPCVLETGLPAAGPDPCKEINTVHHPVGTNTYKGVTTVDGKPVEVIDSGKPIQILPTGMNFTAEGTTGFAGVDATTPFTDDKQTLLRGNVGVDGCHSMLLLADVEVPKNVLSSWHQDRLNESAEWAAAVHLNASDNDDVKVPVKPAYLNAFGSPERGGFCVVYRVKNEYKNHAKARDFYLIVEGHGRNRKAIKTAAITNATVMPDPQSAVQLAGAYLVAHDGVHEDAKVCQISEDALGQREECDWSNPEWQTQYG